MVEGRFVPFVVDTGTPYTTLSSEHAKALGLTPQPCSNPYYLGQVHADILHVLPGSKSTRVLAEDFRFLVRECPSLLGLDFMSSSRSILDLDPRAPRLHVLEMAVAGEGQQAISAVVKVNGMAAMAKVDTGSSHQLSASFEDAMDLGLRLEKIPPIRCRVQTGVKLIEHAAKGVKVAAMGKEVSCDVVVFDLYCLTVTAGMGFLKGARIEFIGDGEWNIRFPPRSDEGAEDAQRAESAEGVEGAEGGQRPKKRPRDSDPVKGEREQGKRSKREPKKRKKKKT